jgi:hypothetical protein
MLDPSFRVQVPQFGASLGVVPAEGRRIVNLAIELRRQFKLTYLFI